MTEPLEIGQFAIVDHQPLERAPCVGVFRGRGPAGDRPELYVLAEGTTPAGEQFAAHVISAAGQAWEGVDMSLTGGLRRLFAEAHRNIADWNAKSIAQHRVALGISAVARRGHQVVLAQAGPALAFHLKAGSARIYAPEGEHARAVGELDVAVAPQLRGLVVEPGDRLLLISTRALELADSDLIGEILSLPAEQVLRDLYQRVRSARNISVLLLAVPAAGGPEPGEGDGEEGTLAIGESTIGANDEFIIGLDTLPSSSSPPYQPSLFIAPGGDAARRRAGRERLRPRSLSSDLPAVEAERIEPLRRAAGDREPPLSRERLVPRRRPGEPPQRRERVEASPPGGRGGESRERGGFYRQIHRTGRAPAPPPGPPEDAPPVEALARARRSQLLANRDSKGEVGLSPGRALAPGSPLVRTRTRVPGRWRGGDSLGGGSSSLSLAWRPSLPLLATALLVAVVLFAVFILPSQFRESKDERYARLVEEAGTAVLAAQDERDPASKRDLLAQAYALLLEARDLRGEGSEVLRLTEDVTAALSRMDAIVTPASVEEVTSLEEFGDQPLAISRLAVRNGVVYMLDPAAGLVVGVSTNGAEKSVVFSESEELGSEAAVAMAAPAGEKPWDGVLVLDAAGRLWAVQLSSPPIPVPLEGPGTLSVTDMAVGDGALYLLDRAAGTVYRSVLDPAGRVGAPAPVLSDEQLKEARYLLPSGAAIITVDDDGSVHRFEGDIVLNFSQAGIDTPLTAAEPPQRTSEPGSVAILDPSQDRVVVLGSDGTFLRQYRHDDFAQSSALVISEQGSFIVSGGTLRRVVWE